MEVEAGEALQQRIRPEDGPVMLERHLNASSASAVVGTRERVALWF